MLFASHTVSDDVDEIGERYAPKGVEIRQLGTGTAPTSATMLAEPRFDVIAGSVGIPTVAWKSMPDDQVTVVMICAATGCSRWTGIDLEAGTVLVYGPGAEHAATNRPGLRFVSIAADPALIESNAELLGVDVALPERGAVHELRPSRKCTVVRPVWDDYLQRARTRRGVAAADGDVIERSLVHLLSDADDVHRVGSERGLDSRDIVQDCIAYAESVDRLPSLGELCLAAHVSERRLRSAFHSLFGLPPSQFFRKWALGEAHRRLRAADHSTAVTDVAADLGFNHLGRFAHHYAETFDEAPSATLRRSFPVSFERG